MPSDFLDELKWRGLFNQCTSEAGLRQHLVSGTRRGYVGYDPTADSLTIGNMVTIMLLAHLQRAGHQPVVVCGGGTGLIGDPSGKSAERQLLSEEKVRANVESQERIFGKLLDLSPGVSNRGLIVNNLDWLGKLGYLEALRDIGKHFSVNMMIQKDSVRERLHARDQGISYTEFSYMILQAYDFLHLYRDMGVTLQMGGSDQWGNIVAGCDLIGRDALVEMHRLVHAMEELNALNAGLPFADDSGTQLGNAASILNRSEPDRAILIDEFVSKTQLLILESKRIHPGMHDYQNVESAVAAASRFRWRQFGLTAPLVTKSDGSKFGKTESGAIWMTADRTSPYGFYQFWLNATDADIPKFLRIFTFLDEPRVNELLAAHEKNPGAREAHRALARHVTTLLHGQTEADAAENAAKALFSGEVGALPLGTLIEVFAEAPSSEHDKAGLEGMALLDLLPLTTLVKSKSEARQALKEGSITINGIRPPDDGLLRTAHLLHGAMIALRRGKKSWHVTRWR